MRPAEVTAGAYLGTATLLHAAQLKTESGMSYGKVAQVLQNLCGLTVSRGGLAQGISRQTPCLSSPATGTTTIRQMLQKTTCG